MLRCFQNKLSTLALGLFFANTIPSARPVLIFEMNLPQNQGLDTGGNPNIMGFVSFFVRKT